MRRPVPIALLAALLVLGASASDARAKTYHFTGGRWFDGRAFEAREAVYVVDGVFTRTRPPEVDETVDLASGFVVPPFAEAHNHNIDGAYEIETVNRNYLRDGIFYVRIANNIGERTPAARAWLEAPGRVDVAFSNGGLTGSGGHPIRLYEETIRPRAYPDKPNEWLRDRAFFVVDDDDALAERWPRILEGAPDFIKVFLLYTEEYDCRRGDRAYYGRRGLDPRLLPAIVQRAHAAGRAVAAHVETAADFRAAVQAGVDQVLHLPGSNIPPATNVEAFRLTAADAARARERGTVVTTTTVISRRWETSDPDRLARAREVQVSNLRLLHEHGVPLAVGSDLYSATALDEVMNLRALDVFDNRTLLNMWCETARAIFPQRRLGRLDEGYEASFLVLDRDPLLDFDNVRSIRYRFKRGHPIELDAAARP